MGLIFGLTVLDQKVRSRTVVSDTLGLPILAVIHQMDTPIGFRTKVFKKLALLSVIILSWVIYGYAAWLRTQGVSFV